jgi:preprotein translocase subunit SecG
VAVIIIIVIVVIATIIIAVAVVIGIILRFGSSAGASPVRRWFIAPLHNY